MLYFSARLLTFVLFFNRIFFSMKQLMNLRFSSKIVLALLKKQPLSTYKHSCVLYSSVIHICNTEKKLLAVPSLLTYHVCFAKKAQGKMSKGGGKTKHVQMSDEEMREVIDIQEYRNQLLLVKERLKKDFAENVILRSASNIENILVKIDDEDYPLQELAQISRKKQNLIAINMVEFPEAIKPAIQAIVDSGIGINPQQDGTMIYLTTAKITREHREALVKSAKTLFVKAKDEIRSIQNLFIKEAKRKTELSEDLIFNTTNQVQSIAEQNVAELDKLLKIKQKDLLGET